MTFPVYLQGEMSVVGKKNKKPILQIVGNGVGKHDFLSTSYQLLCDIGKSLIITSIKTSLLTAQFQQQQQQKLQLSQRAKGTRKFDPHNFQSSSSHDNGTKKNQSCSVTKLHINTSDGLGFLPGKRVYFFILVQLKNPAMIHCNSKVSYKVSVNPFHPKCLPIYITTFQATV